MTQTISQSAGSASASGVTVEPAAGRIGAEISGVDISRPLDSETLAVIQNALDTWKVVFFREQQLDHESQIAFGRQFGDLTYAHPHDDEPPEGYPEIYTVDPRRFEQRYGLERKEREAVRKYSYTSGWHTDVTPAHNPPAGSILRADVVPGYGGDPTFTNLVPAYEGLSEPVRRFVDTLWAEPRYGANASGQRRASKGLSERIEKNSLVSNHPVVRVHPRTGERALFVNPGFVDHIVDVDPLESRWILDHLFAEITRPEYTVRFRWAPGSVAFWDNRATAHLGPQDLGHVDVERVLHRVTLIGEVPVGPDGRESELVEGVPFVATPVFAATGD
jgi:alpha-ketoglutarate-dependent taurine dioxygenase